MSLFRDSRFPKFVAWLFAVEAGALICSSAGTITVESEYGGEIGVTPRVGRHNIADSTQQLFEAAQYVYLNRNFEELDGLNALGDLATLDRSETDDSTTAYYRAVNVGYTLDTDNPADKGTAERTFTYRIDGDATVIWLWELQFAVFLQAETGEGAVDGQTFGNTEPSLGRVWVAGDTEFSATMDRFAEGIAPGGGSRFEAERYELENVRDTSLGAAAGDEFYWRFTESDDDVFLALPEEGAASDSRTVSWWGKIDRNLANERDQIFFHLYRFLDGITTGDEFVNIPALGEARRRGSMTFGVRPDGRLFVEEVTPGGVFRELASVPSHLVGLDWNHWSVDFLAGERQVRVFRNGVRVFSSTDEDYATMGILSGLYNRGVVGAARYGGGVEEFEGGINHLSFWLTGIEEETRRNDALGLVSGNYFFEGFEGTPLGLVGEELIGVDPVPFPETARQVLRTTRDLDFPELGETVGTESVVIDDWLRVTSYWGGQVRYRFNAVGELPGSDPVPFGAQSFGLYYDAAGGAVETRVFSNDPDLEFWVPRGRRVEIGCFYRTFDRRYTLTDLIQPPTGDLAAYGTSISEYLDDVDALDNQSRVRVARVAETLAETASDIEFYYEPTVFRAEVPLGESIDALNPNFHLVPALPDGGALRAGNRGPDDDPTREVTLGLDAGNATGQALRWDRLSRRLFPVHAGTYQATWPDADDSSIAYRIEVVSGYPGQTVRLTSEREDPDTGARQGVAPDYVMETELGASSADFPGSPGAHYRHLFDDDPDRSPPTKLDLSAADHWHFIELTYADSTTSAAVAEAGDGMPFSASGEGRSVALYSYRPNPDEVADGTLDLENLAVRVIDSRRVDPVEPSSVQLALGARALRLTSSDSVGLRADSEVTVDPGSNFAMEFWFNADGLGEEEDVITLLTTGEDRVAVRLDPGNAVLTASCFDLAAEAVLPAGLTGWHHVVLHVFEETFRTTLHLYVDGRRARAALPTSILPAGFSGSFVAMPTLSDTSLILGQGLSPSGVLLFDQVRAFSGVDSSLTPLELLYLRETRSATLRGEVALIHFDFESSSLASSFGPAFLGDNSVDGVAFGPVAASSGDQESENWITINLQEVATPIVSPMDTAGFGGRGYILNPVSNYNAAIYDRAAEVGQWGALYPVNQSDPLFLAEDRQLEVAYYENPFLRDPLSHPNVAWPYQALRYQEVVFPERGPHKDNAIYIASRIGTEGVDAVGAPQRIYRGDRYANLQVYNQPDTEEPGYNPNEEHALVAAPNRAALRVKEVAEEEKGVAPLAAFALQREINVTSGDGYTSDPWVLVQFDDLETGVTEMAAYQVFATRDGAVAFPRPRNDEFLPIGLSYESASNVEDGFLVMEAEGRFDFSYQFAYPAFAGDLLIPPHPLDQVIGNLPIREAEGRSVQVGGVNQRTLWRDVNRNAWVVSGDGQFFHQFFYPLRSDFFLPGAVNGESVAWLPDDGSSFTGEESEGRPEKVLYNTFWRSDYPKLKRGETLTFQGGEFFNENPGSNGLPAIVAMAAAEVVFDSSTPSMLLGGGAGHHAPEEGTARIIRPLDRVEADFTISEMELAGFTPADTEKLFIVAERWYFKVLPGSLQKRFYFDSLTEKLVLRGRLNDREGGDADLTSGPDPINTLEPNVLSGKEYEELLELTAPSRDDFDLAVASIFSRSRDPFGLAPARITAEDTPYLAGLTFVPNDHPSELRDFRLSSNLNSSAAVDPPEVVLLDSFGVGAALVPNPGLLRKSTDGGSLYITIAENNREELNGAPVSLHIIEVIPDRFRGAIKVIEPADAFSEKVTLQHSGEFGANTADLYYEWWIRDAAPLEVVADEVLSDGSLREFDGGGNTLWQEYLPVDRLQDNDLSDFEKHLGLHTVVFEGRPDVVLADKLVLVRYRHRDESDGWNLVPFEIADPALRWRPAPEAPFQWAGAANSPQLQADGSKRYIPQLVMGWVKRVLDRINPYEARYTDFFSNESPAAYTSQIQIAGPPFAGKVALNPNKNVIENTGLIELYETVLQRARELSIDNGSNAVSTDAINQAILLAATRLAVLYELLASEAYGDAQDPTITIGGEEGLEHAASFTHAFQNVEADLLHEELALLRGTDFRKSYPVFNRMIWNYFKGLGEAAYNVNYNIYDENLDGFINEDDARALFPQGHGDAWGHFVSALGMHYTLLQHPTFNWRTRSELYSLIQNVLEVDYLDERTFAQLAANKARAGRDIVRGTYRVHYTQEPDGQWQGYTDDADPARAWGVSEWAHRAGQGAYFDWAVANALLPEEASSATPVENPENLDRIERSGVIDEIAEVAAGMHEIQVAMDEANGGVNPLGFDSGAIAIDLDLEFYENASGGDRRSHAEQIMTRAVTAGNNALATLGHATQALNKLHILGNDTEALVFEALRQDIDYRNRLIEIFGSPYSGTIGFGEVYPEGYQGPDTLLFAYLDRVEIADIVPDGDCEGGGCDDVVTFDSVYSQALGTMDDPVMVELYDDVWKNSRLSIQENINSVFGFQILENFDLGATRLSNAYETLVGGNSYLFEPAQDSTPLTLPYRTASRYGFQAPSNWGQRTSYGRIQTALEEMLLEEIALDAAIIDYIGFLQDWEVKTRRLESELELYEQAEILRTRIDRTRFLTNGIITGLRTALGIKALVSGATVSTSAALDASLPETLGFSNDTTSAARGVAVGIQVAAKEAFDGAEIALNTAETLANFVRDEIIATAERELTRVDKVSALEGMIEELANLSGGDQPKRDAIGAAIQNLELKRQDFFTARAEGFRLLREREAFNKNLAASVQKKRYQDMALRLTRNETMSKYQSSFQNAARYTWLAARAYDYETALSPGHPAAANDFFDRIVKERQLGLWVDGEPQAGQGGLAEILSQLKGNFDVLKGQLGISNPQSAVEKISMRAELFRIAPVGTVASDDRWEDALKARIVDDLTVMPEFRRHCRPFSSPEDGPQPGIVIRFATQVQSGLNFFGNRLAPGDHTYSTSNYATRIRGLGVWLENYNAAGLSTTPRAYLVPVGNDYSRTSSSGQPAIRQWKVVEQRIPTPFVINQSQLWSPNFMPTLNGPDGIFGELRRHGDFRMFHDNGDPSADESEIILDTRLIGRSIWNSQWLLIIPGAGLFVDPELGLNQFAENVSDILLHFQTYSQSGQ